MHLAVNAHLLSPVGGYRQAGVSTYIHQLLEQLLPLASADRWTVYAPRGVERVLPPASNVHLRLSRLPTTNPIGRIFWEQTIAPLALLRDRPAVLFCPLNVVPLLTPCPRVVTIHDLSFLRFPDRFRAAKRHYLTALARISVERATHVLTVSEFTRQEVISLLGVPPEKVTATPNGRDENLAPLSTERVEQFRVAKQLPERFILSLNTLEPRKNLTTLLRAYARIKDVVAMPLVVVGGKGWMYGPIFELVDDLGLRDRVRFTGFVPREELALWYNAATVFVYPSLYEGFGLPPLEALQCGTPVITSNAASMPEVVGDAAVTFDPLDIEGLSTVLLRVIGDDALRQELRQRGPKQAARFSWKRTAAQTLEVLHAVARP